MIQGNTKGMLSDQRSQMRFDSPLQMQRLLRRLLLILLKKKKLHCDAWHTIFPDGRKHMVPIGILLGTIIYMIMSCLFLFYSFHLLGCIWKSYWAKAGLLQALKLPLCPNSSKHFYCNFILSFWALWGRLETFVFRLAHYRVVLTLSTPFVWPCTK